MEGVLDFVAELREDAVRDVRRVLGDEVDADTLRTDEFDDLLDLLEQFLGGVVEEHVRLIEEEDDLRLLGVADFGKGLIELGHHPQHEGGIHGRVVHELLAVEDVDLALAGRVGREPVVDVEGGLAEELVAAFGLERDDRADDGGEGLLRDVAVAQRVVLRVLADIGQHGAQVFGVDEEDALVIGDLEDDLHDGCLRVVEPEDAGEEERADLGDGGAQRQAHFLVDVPEGDRVALELEPVRGKAHLVHALLDRLDHGAGLAESGKVAFGVGEEHRDAGVREGLRDDAQGRGLTGTGGTGDEAVAIRLAQVDTDFFAVGIADINFVVK